MSRRLARELAFQVLFQVDIGHVPWKEAIRRILEENRLPDKSKRFLEESVTDTLKNLKQLDDILSRLSVEWPINRMANTDKNILRLAVCELLYRQDIPVEVTVNEAVELAKKYGEEDSGRFVNGLLGNLVKQIQNSIAGLVADEEDSKGEKESPGVPNQEKVKQ